VGGFGHSPFFINPINKMEMIILADMESNGIYFSEEIKEELEKQREELYCEYSGLLSVKAYEYVK
jgi:hypothetical protein